MDAITRLLKPRSVAVIGASADVTKTAGRPVSYLVKHGFTGKIFPVNPKASEIWWIVMLSRPAFTAGSAGRRDRAARCRTRATGCARAGAVGGAARPSSWRVATRKSVKMVRRQQQLIEAAGSMRILGPNTIGLVNITDGVVPPPSGALEMDHFPSGAVGVVSQSGGILGSLLSRAAARGIGLSKLISTSNEVDLELADFIDWLVDDPATKVIALYVETVRDTERFRAAALRAACAGKSVVAFKIGRSEAGAKAAVSHTGALAGTDRMYDALFRQVGVIRADRFDDLLDIPAALAAGRTLRGKRVAILTSTGGAGTLVSDELGMAGFDTPVPDAATAQALRALQTGDQAALDRNPIDVTLAGQARSVARRDQLASTQSDL